MTPHIVKRFDDELMQLTNMIAQMGGLAESQVAMSVESIRERDSDVAERVVMADSRIDTLEAEVNNQVVSMLALRQPMAQDLRECVSALKISADLERIGDLAKNTARRAISISHMAPITAAYGLPRMAELVRAMIRDVLDAYIDRDAVAAMEVWHKDAEVDAMHTGMFRELLTYMMEDHRNITPCTHLLFIGKNIERIGDHTTNIAETVHFLATGNALEVERPKQDDSSGVVVSDTLEADINSAASADL